MLLKSFEHMRSSQDFVYVQLTESWMREYQIPINLLGTHPTMSTSGSGGFLLSAIKVFCDIDVTPHDKYIHKAKKAKTDDAQEPKPTEETV